MPSEHLPTPGSDKEKNPKGLRFTLMFSVIGEIYERYFYVLPPNGEPSKEVNIQK